jgi:hypothetical protein
VAQAGKRGVIVELSLFCPFYNEDLWNVSPWNARNNINGVGDLPRTETMTMKNGSLLAIQEAMVRTIVSELREFDNLYYEICNEPYFGGVTLDWQHHIAETIVKVESGFTQKHLIAQNIANGSTRIEKPHPAVSIFNFHYSRPPDSVRLNHGLNKAIGLNETGFDGQPIQPIGLGLISCCWRRSHNNLDYSFTAEHPDGTHVPDGKTPGGGSPALRRQLKVLKDFIHGCNFLAMSPQESVISGGVPEGATIRVLAELGRDYAIYIHHGKPGFGHNSATPSPKPKPLYWVAPEKQQIKLSCVLPPGSYEARWIDTKTGRMEKIERLKGSAKPLILASPPYREDIALGIRRR